MEHLHVHSMARAIEDCMLRILFGIIRVEGIKAMSWEANVGNLAHTQRIDLAYSINLLVTSCLNAWPMGAGT